MLVDDRDCDHRGTRFDRRVLGSDLTLYLAEPSAHRLHHLWANAMADRFLTPCNGSLGIGLVESPNGLA